MRSMKSAKIKFVEGDSQFFVDQFTIDEAAAGKRTRKQVSPGSEKQ